MPFRSMVDQVAQHFTADESVSYLSHVLGITSETHVMFVRVSPGETLIRVGMNLVGKISRALGFAIEPTILNTTKRFFADLARECEAAAKDAGPKHTSQLDSA